MGVESERFARLRLLFKNEGLQKLQDATVMVLGLGGVGSACAEALARGGVGNLIVLDLHLHLGQGQGRGHGDHD